MKKRVIQNNNTKRLFEELQAKHRKIKKELLDLMANKQRSKEQIHEELFKIYLELK